MILIIIIIIIIINLNYIINKKYSVLPSENDVAGLQPRTNAVKKKTKENNLNESISTSSTQKSSFITTLNDPGNTNAPKREKIAFGLKRKAEQEINPVFKKRE